MSEGEAIFAGLRDELFGWALAPHEPAGGHGAHPLESLDGERRILELCGPHGASALPMHCKADVVRASDCAKLSRLVPRDATRAGREAALFDVILVAQDFGLPPRMEPFFRRLHSLLRPGGRVMGALSAADHLAQLWASSAAMESMQHLGLAPPRRFHAAGVAGALHMAGFWVHRVCHESCTQSLSGGHDGLRGLVDAMRRSANPKSRGFPDAWMERLAGSCRERMWRGHSWSVTSAAIEFVAVRLDWPGA